MKFFRFFRIFRHFLILLWTLLFFLFVNLLCWLAYYFLLSCFFLIILGLLLIIIGYFTWRFIQWLFNICLKLLLRVILWFLFIIILNTLFSTYKQTGQRIFKNFASFQILLWIKFLLFLSVRKICLIFNILFDFFILKNLLITFILYISF